MLFLYRSYASVINRIPALAVFAGQGGQGGISQNLQNSWLHTSALDCAARKGTREKARKKKIKVEVKKLEFIPFRLRDKKKTVYVYDKHLDDQNLKTCDDDVHMWLAFKRKRFPADEALNRIREMQHPTLYNEPNAFVYAKIELNMQGEKKTRFLESYTKTVLLPHPFLHGSPRTILAFCKDIKMQNQAIAAGASICGAQDVIRTIQNGDLNPFKYDFVIAHPDVLTELVPIRGLLKRKFPSPAHGTMDTDIPALVKKLCTGLQYKANKDQTQKNYAEISVPIGQLSLSNAQLIENYAFLLQDINSGRPKRSGLFVTRSYFSSPPSIERVRVNPFDHIPTGLDIIEEADNYEEELLASVEDSDDEDDKKKATSK